MRTKRNDKIYTYPTRTLAIDADVFEAVKAIAKTKRTPLYRLVSDICRKWLVRYEKRQRASIEEIAIQQRISAMSDTQRVTKRSELTNELKRIMDSAVWDKTEHIWLDTFRVGFQQLNADHTRKQV